MLQAGIGIGFQLMAQAPVGPPIQAHALDAGVKEVVGVDCGVTFLEGPLLNKPTALLVTVETLLSKVTWQTLLMAAIPEGWGAVMNCPAVGNVLFREKAQGECGIILRNAIEVPTQPTAGSMGAKGDSHHDGPVFVIDHLEAKICL